MRKLMLSALATCVMVSTTAAFAADTKKEAPKKEVAAKEATVTGWVTDPMCGAKHAMADKVACTKSCAKDGKLALVTDGDNKVWAVVNSEALKGHEGHHVKVTGHPDVDKGTIHVMSVAMVDAKPATSKKSDMKKDEMKSDKKMDNMKKDEKKS